MKRTKALVIRVFVQDVSVNNVEEYKYLGVYSDNKQHWAKNSEWWWSVVSERRVLSKILFIFDNVSHPLNDTLVRYRSTFSDRLVLPGCSTKRHRTSFLPVAIKLLNASL